MLPHLVPPRGPASSGRCLGNSPYGIMGADPGACQQPQSSRKPPTLSCPSVCDLHDTSSDMESGRWGWLSWFADGLGGLPTEDAPWMNCCRRQRHQRTRPTVPCRALGRATSPPAHEGKGTYLACHLPCPPLRCNALAIYTHARATQSTAGRHVY